MNKEELTPHFEELKRELAGKVTDEQLWKELNTYLNEYRVSIDATKSGIKRKYGADPTIPFVSAESASKKVAELTGSEMRVDITAKVSFVRRKTITTSQGAKNVVEGTLGDETGTAPFTIWGGEDMELEAGKTYVFRNAYTKKWNEKIQVNIGSRGAVEKAESEVSIPEGVAGGPAEVKIGDLREGSGEVTVTGRLISLESRKVIARGEEKVVRSGTIADSTGKIQFSAWSDFGLKDGEAYKIKGAGIRVWKGILQLNLGDRCEVSRVADSFGEIDLSAPKKTVAEIMASGGGALDVSVSGTVVDLKNGSGLIMRCPRCNRSVLNDSCSEHGPVTPVMDLRMKLTLDDGTGAIGVVVGRADTEKLTGVTFAAAEGLAKARGDRECVGREFAQMMIMKRMTARGNVLCDDFGPQMTAASASLDEIDVHAEAKRLYDEVEAAL
ncbi:MAG: single-stranded DNA-binding protein [Candidatus Methanoplasma sp.]|jgi:replication factor A1|nr:single-stranded DNA-binding protein [Candidatus Methanoplasma sp.]